MKTKITALVIFLTAATVSAQFKGFHIGGRFGIGQSNTSYKTDGISPALSSKLFVSGGITSNYQFNRFLGINTDILISQKSTEYTSSIVMEDISGVSEQPYRNQISGWWLDVPVTGQFSFKIKEFGVRYYAGPQAGFNLVATETREYDNKTYQEENGYYRREYRNVNITEFAFLQGLGICARDKGERIYFLDFRIAKGFTPFTKINGNNVYNNNFSLSAGCMF